MNAKNLVTILLGLALMNTLPLAVTADDTPEEIIVNATPTITTPRPPSSVSTDDLNSHTCAVDDPDCLNTSAEPTDCEGFPDCEAYGNDECAGSPSWGWVASGEGDGRLRPFYPPDDHADWTRVPVLRTQALTASSTGETIVRLKENCGAGPTYWGATIYPGVTVQPSVTMISSATGHMGIGVQAHWEEHHTTSYTVAFDVLQTDAYLLRGDETRDLVPDDAQCPTGLYCIGDPTEQDQPITLSDAGDTRQTATLLEPTTVGDPIEWSGAIDEFRDGIFDSADWYEIKPRPGSYQVTVDVDCTGAGGGLDVRVVYERPDVPNQIEYPDEQEWRPTDKVSCGSHTIPLGLLELPWPLKIGVGTHLDGDLPSPDDLTDDEKVARAYTVTVERIPSVLDELFVNTVVEMYTDPALDQVPDPLPDPLPEGWEECVDSYAQALMDLLFPSPQVVECEEDPLDKLPLP